MVNFKRDLLPPIVARGVRYAYRRFKKAVTPMINGSYPGHQDLDVYWNPQMADILETWGEGSVWNEIQFLLINCKGRVLDLACGTGKAMEINSKFLHLDIYGCDISDFLINKAVERGLDKNRLVVCDATKTNYPNSYFDFAYSIGSLEHFTEEGIHAFLIENKRIVKHKTFHSIPISKNNQNNGWIKTFQSYYNNSITWWIDKFTSVYSNVEVLDSAWSDDISLGKWFICSTEN